MSRKATAQATRTSKGSRGGRRTGPGRRYVKLAITVPAAQARAIRKAVAQGAAASVSAFLSQAAEEKLEDGALRDLVADMKTEFGDPEPDVIAQVESALERQRLALRREK